MIKKEYETTPKNWRFALSYSKALDKKGETKNAISVLEKAYKESPENYSIGMQLTESWVKINQFEKAIQLLNNLTVLPFEHDTGARTIYTKAYIGAALNALINRQWDGAAALLSTSLEWPERLGVGKPFDAEERINNFLLAFVREMKNEDSNEYYTNVIDYSKKHIAKGGVNCILGLYAIEMKEGKEAAKIYAQQLEGSVPNSEIEKVLSFYNNNPIQKLDVTFLKQLVEFILN
jgi:tetratricopeptide (TPR) repeat protein